MKALRWHGRNDVRYEDVPDPSPSLGQAKVKIHYTGICGSDLHEYHAGPIFIPLEPHPLTGSMAPLTLGHEFSGRVVEVGEGVTSLKAGDRVTGDCMWVCGDCYYCKRSMPSLCVKAAFTGLSVHGSMAEYLVAPDYSFYKIPDSVPDDIAALTEPLAVAVHAVRKSKLQVGATVAIVGAGPIGDCCLLAAKASGASKVFLLEYSKMRREMAMGMGATAVIDPNEGDPVAQVRELTDGLGADVVFECVGHRDSPPLAIKLARNAGTIAIVGIFEEASPGMHFGDVVFGEKTIVGCLAYAREAPFVLEMVADGRIDASKLITKRIQLKDTVEQGFEELLTNKEANLKVLLESPNWS